ncbi:MAG: hypothetical protein J7L63_00440, partial [Thermoplasmata archaeon]|nr:hypothetical protein [Thermoplasmata archaeon]
YSANTIIHNQTGIIERFFQTYAKHRHAFSTKDEFLHWYNCVRPHMSLNLDVLETPEKAFYRKAQDIMPGNFLRLVENMIGGANDNSQQTN